MHENGSSDIKLYSAQIDINPNPNLHELIRSKERERERYERG